eukprot:9495712-Pyramimonas_sp.AAC.1
MSTSWTSTRRKSHAREFQGDPGVPPFRKQHALHPTTVCRMSESWTSALRKLHAKAPFRKMSRPPSVVVLVQYGTPDRR